MFPLGAAVDDLPPDSPDSPLFPVSPGSADGLADGLADGMGALGALGAAEAEFLLSGGAGSVETAQEAVAEVVAGATGDAGVSKCSQHAEEDEFVSSMPK